MSSLNWRRDVCSYVGALPVTFCFAVHFLWKTTLARFLDVW